MAKMGGSERVDSLYRYLLLGMQNLVILIQVGVSLNFTVMSV